MAIKSAINRHEPDIAPSAEGAERREHPRLGCNIKAVWWKASGFRRSARLLNVSKKGALMRLSLALMKSGRVEIGDVLALRGRFRGEVGNVDVTATVRWVGQSRRFAAVICGLQIAQEDIPKWSAAVAATTRKGESD